MIKDKKVGDTFEFSGFTWIVTGGRIFCHGCEAKAKYCGKINMVGGECIQEFRADRKNIVFKKVKK